MSLRHVPSMNNVSIYPHSDFPHTDINGNPIGLSGYNLATPTQIAHKEAGASGKVLSIPLDIHTERFDITFSMIPVKNGRGEVIRNDIYAQLTMKSKSGTKHILPAVPFTKFDKPMAIQATERTDKKITLLSDLIVRAMGEIAHEDYLYLLQQQGFYIDANGGLVHNGQVKGKVTNILNDGESVEDPFMLLLGELANYKVSIYHDSIQLGREIEAIFMMYHPEKVKSEGDSNSIWDLTSRVRTEEGRAGDSLAHDFSLTIDAVNEYRTSISESFENNIQKTQIDILES